MIDVNVIGEELCWPVLLVYEESRCTDFLRQVRCSFSYLLPYCMAVLGDSNVGRDTYTCPRLPLSSFLGSSAHVLACYSQPLLHRPSGASSSSSPSRLNDHQVPVMAAGKREWLEDPVTQSRLQPKWKRIDMGWTLEELLQAEGHVVPGYPVLHVVLSVTAA
eukprot:748255-Hanusia_phi.AAC.3